MSYPPYVLEKPITTYKRFYFYTAIIDTPEGPRKSNWSATTSPGECIYIQDEAMQDECYKHFANPQNKVIISEITDVFGCNELSPEEANKCRSHFYSFYSPSEVGNHRIFRRALYTFK